MLPNIVCNLQNDNDWDRNQIRTLDPYSLLRSDTLNQINTIYGDNTILTGMEMLSIPDSLLKLTIKPGNCIKDKVLIQFKNDTVIFIDYNKPEFKELVEDNSIMIVVSYKYEKKIPANIAKIEVIQEEEYDPDIHLGLYRIFFDSNGNISETVRLLTPKDNIIYEQILQEINSTAISAVYNTLSDLGNDGLAELIGMYMRIKGSSIAGEYFDKKYFLCRAVPKVNFNLNTGAGEPWRNSLHIIASYCVNNKYYLNDYTLSLNTNDYTNWNVFTQFLTTDSGNRSYLPYFDVEVYDDREYYYVYAYFKGNITGSLEVYETEYNSDQVHVYNLEERTPNESMLFSVSERTNKIPSNSYINNCIVWNESNDGSNSGLDADKLDGHHSQYFVDKINELRNDTEELIASVNNRIDELKAYVDENYIPLTQKDAENGVAILTGSDSTYTDVNGELQNDTSPVGKVVPQSELYIDRMFGPDGIVFTNDDTDPTGTRRINCEGLFHATKVYNPAFKDIAEVFEAESGNNMVNCVRKIMALDPSSGLIRRCKPTDYTIVGVCSDTYGYLLGASEDDITKTGNLLPIGLAGTVWVDIENTLDTDVNYLGCLIGVGANGKGRIMARTDKRFCVGMVVECNPDKYSNRVKILIGNRWVS